MPKNRDSRGKSLGIGALVGMIAALFMTLVLLLLRYFFGVGTPSELVGDRIAPLLGVDRFLELLTRFGGYNNLTQIGVMSVIGGQLVVGALGGLAYAFIATRPRTIGADSRRSGSGRSRSGKAFPCETVNAGLRGKERGIALPLLLDLARKPVFLHDSVPTLDNLLNPARGARAPHPFYLSGATQRADMVEFLRSLDTNSSSKATRTSVNPTAKGN